MIKNVVLVSGDKKVIQLYIYMYLLFFKLFFPFRIGCYIILNRDQF